jgi:hypothetical protein
MGRVLPESIEARALSREYVEPLETKVVDRYHKYFFYFVE